MVAQQVGGDARRFRQPFQHGLGVVVLLDDADPAAIRVLPKSETRRVYNAVLKRYWYHAPWFYVQSIVRGGIDGVHVGLEIKAAG